MRVWGTLRVMTVTAVALAALLVVRPPASAEVLAWPSDVGTSHFGLMGYAGEAPAFPGAWVRPHAGEAIWGAIERERGAGYRWGNLDAEVRAAQANHTALLITIWPFAQWDQDACHASDPSAPASFFRSLNRLYAPCDRVAYTAFIGALVDRYDGDGSRDMPGLLYPVRHWEVGNEPELQGATGGNTFFQGTAASYADLLKITATAIRGTDAQAVVLAGGQAGMLPEHAAFWSPVLSDAAGAFEIGNVHSIRGSESFYSAEYRAFLDQRGLASRRFWITEAQVGSIAENLSDDMLAQRTITGYAAAFANGASVIFRVPAGSPNSGNYGPLAEGAFTQLATNIGTFTTATWDGPNRVRFVMPDGTTVFVLWSGARLPDGLDGSITALSHLGQRSTPKASDVVAATPMMIRVTPPAPGAVEGSAAFATPPTFSPTGQALAIFSGGSVDQLEAAAAATRATGVWAQDGSGAYHLLVVGGPAFLKDEFKKHFAGLRPSTVVTLTR